MARKRKKEISGIMVYFDAWSDCLDEFTHTELGELFSYMIRYGQNGELPTFSEAHKRIKWREIQRSIDRDRENYLYKCLESEYAAACKKDPSLKEKIGLEEWIEKRSITS